MVLVVNIWVGYKNPVTVHCFVFDTAKIKSNQKLVKKERRIATTELSSH